jgi:hypothetical protein
MKIDISVAEQFGRAVVRGNFAAAYALLTKDAQQIYTPEAMEVVVADMISYADEPLVRSVVMIDHVMDDWPDKKQGDVACLYISLEAESFSEGAMVILTKTADGIRIREIEWGRP